MTLLTFHWVRGAMCAVRRLDRGKRRGFTMLRQTQAHKPHMAVFLPHAAVAFWALTVFLSPPALETLWLGPAQGMVSVLSVSRPLGQILIANRVSPRRHSFASAASRAEPREYLIASSFQAS